MFLILFNFLLKPNPQYENIAAGLRTQGHTVWLGSRNQDGNLQWHDGKQIVGVVKGPYGKLLLLKRIPIVSKIQDNVLLLLFLTRIGFFLRRSQPDIIQMDPGGLTFQWVIKLFKPANTLLVLDIRQINLGIRHDAVGKFKEWWQVRKLRNLVRQVDFTFFCHARAAQRIAGNNWEKIATVVPVGINDRFYQCTPKPIDPEANEPVRFIYVGGLARFRELENILYAALQASQRTTAFKIILVGPDKANGYYHNLVKELGLEKVVEIRSAVPNDAVPSLMAEFDVGIAYTPKRNTWDFQPTIKIIEYRALGLPIISFDVVAHREWVTHEKNGLLLTYSIENLAQGILRYVIDRGFLQQCAMNALAMRNKGQTVSDVCNMYADEYARLLKKTRSVKLAKLCK